MSRLASQAQFNARRSSRSDPGPNRAPAAARSAAARHIRSHRQSCTRTSRDSTGRARSIALASACTSAGSELASINSTAGKLRVQHAGVRRRERATPAPVRSPPAARHPLDGQRQHRVQPVLKSQIEQLARRHTQAAARQRHPQTAAAPAPSAPRHRETPAAAPGSSTAGPAPGSPAARSPPAGAPASGPAAGPGRLLRIQRLAQLAGGDPALLQHHQAQRNAMPVALRRRCPGRPARAAPPRRPAPPCRPPNSSIRLQRPAPSGCASRCSQPEPQPGLAQVSNSPRHCRCRAPAPASAGSLASSG